MKVREEHLKYYIASGIAAVIVRNTYSFFAKLIGLANFYIWQVGGSLFTTVPQVTTFWGNVLGILTDIVVASFFGVLFGFFLEWRGLQQYLLKGLGAGLAVWFFFYGLLYHNLPFTKGFAPADALSNISAFIGHSIFGLTMAIVLVNYFLRNASEANEKVESSARGRNVKKETATNEEDGFEAVYNLEPQIILVEVERKKHPMLLRIIRAIKPRKI